MRTRGKGPSGNSRAGNRRNDSGRQRSGTDRPQGRPDARDRSGRAERPEARDRSGRPERQDSRERTGRPSGDRPRKGAPAQRAQRGPRPEAGGGARPARPARQRTGFQIQGELIYGRNAVRESLRANRRVPTRLLIADGVREDERIAETIDLAREHGAMLEQVPRMLLDDLTKGGNHQGVGLETGEYLYEELEDVLGRPGTVLVMDHLNDPQNFGTLIRAADAAGIAGIVIPNDRSVSVTPAVVNASAGAVEHVMVAQVPNLARAVDKIEESGRWIIGLDEDEESVSLFDYDIPTPVGLVLGAEGSGISPIVRKRCQVVLSIPMRGHVDSLNAATAGSIVLYDILRREATQ